jgi:hypothetical protein
MPPTLWIKSEAKEILKKDIIDGIVNDTMDARYVYLMHEEYKEYDFKKFQNNFRSLKKVIKKHIHRAQDDDACLKHDLVDHHRNDVTSGGFPFWDTSNARVLLKKDIDEGLHNQMRPMELWQSRNEYQEFTLKKFRDHVTQESRRRKQNAYWLHKSTREQQT